VILFYASVNIVQYDLFECVSVCTTYVCTFLFLFENLM